MEEKPAIDPVFNTGLRAIAAFEMTKGAAVLAAGVGAMSNRLPRMIADTLSEMPIIELSWLAVAAALYALVRFVEAYGLWHRRRWAEWFAAVSWAVYLPVEIWALLREATRIKGALLALNLGIVLFLTWTLWSRPSTRILTE